jgi:hypothetical protein
MFKHTSFNSIWQATLERYQHQVAYYKNNQAFTYQDLEAEASQYRRLFSGQSIIRINGLDENWLAQAIAAWTEHQLVVIFDPHWQESNPKRYALTMHTPENIHEISQPHLLLFTSGTTGIPKPIIRNTEFALFEADAYIKDIKPQQFSFSICLIKPWFGAITKHCLGMLFSGTPQFFSKPDTVNKNDKILLYGTPSLIANHPISCHAISLTGETINAHHVQTFRQILHPNGFILNAYGSTECGVIARKNIPYERLDELLGKGFHGDVLPGKKIHIDDDGFLSVQTLHEPPMATGDIAKLDGHHLYLLGRLSSKHKIRGQWVDTSPLLHLLTTHPDIYHVEISPQHTDKDELILHVCATSSLQIGDLYQWVFQYAPSLKLMPQLILQHHRPDLGETGKQKIVNQTAMPPLHAYDYISQMVSAILNNLPDRAGYMDATLEQQGFDSIDFVSFVLELEAKSTSNFPVRTLLKTDTPRQIAQLIHGSPGSSFIRTIQNQNSASNCTVICIGSGMMSVRHQISSFANIHYIEILEKQKTAFTLQALACHIIEKENLSIFSGKPIFLTGFSIHALFALELGYQLEQMNIPIKGIFLLDPPHAKRAWTLKLKKPLLITRLKILNRHKPRYQHEIRKLAIAKQSRRKIMAPTLSVYASGKYCKSPWIESMSQHQSIELDFSGHLELVNSSTGIESWINHYIEFLK